ncbi:hypothetical protein OHT52_30735 [Streptomyces sp. NBC_00247]|uniref:hypothetical protein n=1 Tax=Streptomyces sp. NBC_00247 TaxID=2975689 RepID=UPI002E2DE835|nr:hypothetical protein [Streptomyces sp. NBC_00247]
MLEQALRGSYGRRTPAFALLVVDEAHRTSGDATKAWAAVHDRVRIPVQRRLYTDDTELHGPVLHETGLMENVERGILARFEIDVLETRDPSPLSETTTATTTATDEERRGRQLAALQASLLKHADGSGTRSSMTFHRRTRDRLRRHEDARRRRRSPLLGWAPGPASNTAPSGPGPSSRGGSSC